MAWLDNIPILTIMISSIIFSTTSFPASSQISSTCGTLTILHTNDVHARMEQFGTYGGRCTEKDAAQNNCFGGFPRQVTIVKELRAKEPNVLFLNGGDYYQGTIWYSLLKAEPLIKFVNMLNHTAISLGNHEFDDGVSGLLPFVANVTAPFLAANLDTTQEPEFGKHIKKSVTVEIGGCTVGIIGYVTTDTLFISSPGNKLKFLDEVESIKSEVSNLKANGVDIFIAVGHAGYEIDKMIASQVEDIDLVVGGHTNTFLYTGTPPSVEKPVDVYPTVVRQTSGRNVPVVQAYAYGKYMGHLTIEVDTHGEFTTWSGSPILLDKSVEQDQETLTALIPFREELDKKGKEPVGETRVFLEAYKQGEGNLANLITDAMVHMNVDTTPKENTWSDVAIAIQNVGGIRTSIDEVETDGKITVEDVLTVLPFQNVINVVKLKGSHLKEAMDQSLNFYGYQGLRPTGGFLQVSGIRVLYDAQQDPGKRIAGIWTRCKQCRVPAYSPVDDNEEYLVAMPSFLANGGDGYDVIKNHGQVLTLQEGATDKMDSDVVIDYIKRHSPVTQGLEARIQFVDTSKLLSTSSANGFQFHSSLLFVNVILIYRTFIS